MIRKTGNQTVEFLSADDQAAVAKRKPRTVHDVKRFLDALKQRPSEWAIYSRHSSRNSARVRVYQLRRSYSFTNEPVEFATQRNNDYRETGDQAQEFYVLVRRNPDTE